jgi:plastocyanin
VRFVIIAAIVCQAACSSPNQPVAELKPGVDVGSLMGTIVVDGTVPPADVIRLDSDPKCLALAAGEERRAEHVVLGSGNTLQDAFVYVKDGLPAAMYPVPARPVVLDQQKCRYVPRVLGVQVGQQLTVRNSDPLLHNVRAESTINEPFDVGTPVQNIEVPKTFATREVMVPVKCNVHPWMNAYIGVLEHPFFAVSDGSGRFSIAALPPGTYTIEVWHERFGTQTQQVTLAAKETKTMTFSYKAS